MLKLQHKGLLKLEMEKEKGVMIPGSALNIKGKT